MLCNDLNINDTWRLLNPTTKRYTWKQGGSVKTLKQSRLDYWLTSTHMLYELNQIAIETGFHSDHSLIEISFSKKETSKRGPSFWRFNASLLKDKEYVTYIKKRISEIKEKYQNEDNLGLKWDLTKIEIRSSTICYSKTKAKKNRSNIK